MKVVVFGASGRVGSHFIQQAAAAGNKVTAVVRKSTGQTIPNVEFLIGNVLDPGFVARAVAGHDVVMSALGMRYAHPWARRESPDNFTSAATKNIVEGMKKAGVKRLSIVSAAGVGDSRGALNGPMQFMLNHSNVGVAYADLERAEEILRGSGLEWQAVRPVTLSNAKGSPKGEVSFPPKYGMLASIPRADVAAFMLKQLAAPKFLVETPLIAKK